MVLNILNGNFWYLSPHTSLGDWYNFYMREMVSISPLKILISCRGSEWSRRMRSFIFQTENTIDHIITFNFFVPVETLAAWMLNQVFFNDSFLTCYHRFFLPLKKFDTYGICRHLIDQLVSSVLHALIILLLESYNVCTTYAMTWGAFCTEHDGIT